MERYPCIFSRQTEAIVFIILQVLCNTRKKKMFTNGLLFAANNEIGVVRGM